MGTDTEGNYLVAVIGAGPAGIFAAKELAANGISVLMFNRDVKPGGLAEYGIFPDKHKMKDGLRNQFRNSLGMDSIQYFGNVKIGENADLSLDALRALGVQAFLVTVGAQGTKLLGLPGENLRGVYHAKDLVYHYNRLPPFSQRNFEIGRRVAIVGVGNVMMDLSHYLIYERKVDEIIGLARRGPAEIKFDKPELEYVVPNLDFNALDQEIDNAAELMHSLAQDPEKVRMFVRSALEKAHPLVSNTHLTLRFLLSPHRMIGDENGQLKALEVEHNTLVLAENGDVKARGLGTYETIDVDTMIYAIGDKVDEGLGLPVANNEFIKTPEPRYPVEGNSHEILDPATGRSIPDIFVAGWARHASTGLVGIARRDGMNGARALLNYLGSQPKLKYLPLNAICKRLSALGHPVVDKQALPILEAAERERASALGLPEFKYSSVQEMLEIIQEHQVEA